ncbi:uroporphyrinogen-III synthase [Hydrogenovibrio sp. 3SP14C1]|uniref:uroporphyrinogen-III synthase n=1 Tax=Hydrogenovibrio sp. 3SP14C1 TaxID=3038774 RepID=UPI00241689D4|nr:uroporphyrinogen-III synthase [Hydrogenovibrio sp. 3SP14C1]MDG4813587.1 uroporphyrinogen-III synthase [Hydrogenovibrio sp. 3SP14C1]
MTKPDPVLTFLNTRPIEQAAALSQSVQQKGHQVLECPSLKICPLPLPEQAEKTLPKFDKVFFISQNAVKQLVEKWQSAYQTLPVFANHTSCFAIGQSTYLAMESHDWPVVKLNSSQYVTETLLELDDLQDLTNQQCLIVKGKGGRTALAEGLKAAGATVTEWALYERKSADFCASEWQAFQKARHPVLLISSLEAWYRLEKMLKENNEDWAKKDQAWLFLQDIIVFSDRIKNALQQQGWKGRLFVVPQQSNSGILTALEQISIEC